MAHQTNRTSCRGLVGRGHPQCADIGRLAQYGGYQWWTHDDGSYAARRHLRPGYLHRPQHASWWIVPNANWTNGAQRPRPPRRARTSPRSAAGVVDEHGRRAHSGITGASPAPVRWSADAPDQCRPTPPSTCAQAPFLRVVQNADAAATAPTLGHSHQWTYHDSYLTLQPQHQLDGEPEWAAWSAFSRAKTLADGRRPGWVTACGSHQPTCPRHAAAAHEPAT